MYVDICRFLRWFVWTWTCNQAPARYESKGKGQHQRAQGERRWWGTENSAAAPKGTVHVHSITMANTTVKKEAPNAVECALVLALHGVFLAMLGAYGSYTTGWVQMHSVYSGIGCGAILLLCAGATGSKVYLVRPHGNFSFTHYLPCFSNSHT